MSKEYGVWSMEYGVWSMEYGVWSMEYGVWSQYRMAQNYNAEDAEFYLSLTGL
jgi:hypothetical protein